MEPLARHDFFKYSARRAFESAGRIGMRSLSSGCSPAWPCAAGLPARVGAADCAIVKSMHGSFPGKQGIPGHARTRRWPQLVAPSGDAKAAPSIEPEEVYAGARLCLDQSLSMAVHLRPEPRALVQKSSIKAREVGQGKCEEEQIGKSISVHLLPSQSINTTLGQELTVHPHLRPQ
jgi:hypothetical protein